MMLMGNRREACPARDGSKITALEDVAFGQRAGGEMFINSASVLVLPIDFANMPFSKASHHI